MFSGIVDHVGHIVSITHGDQTRHFSIQSQFNDLQLGESIAVDGMCLTVTDFDDQGVFGCDLSPETLNLTKAAHYLVGRKINLERSLRVGDRIGGHFVSGHVECVAMVASKTVQDGCCHLVIEGIAGDDMGLLIHKGSVTVDGVSLTVNALRNNGFDLMLIPQTLALTTLKYLSDGDHVHIEFDQIAKLVARQLEVRETQEEITHGT
ncbi:MAG: riboflavin synthase [Coxiellaceae bacterium]|nr:riboflavin synthase [Coxiellaceae bacterium]